MDDLICMAFYLFCITEDQTSGLTHAGDQLCDWATAQLLLFLDFHALTSISSEACVIWVYWVLFILKSKPSFLFRLLIEYLS